MVYLRSLSLLAAAGAASASWADKYQSPHLAARAGKHVGPNPGLNGIAGYRRSLEDADAQLEERSGKHIGPQPTGFAGFARGEIPGLYGRMERRFLDPRDVDTSCPGSNATTLGIQGTCFPALQSKWNLPVPTTPATPEALAEWWCPDQLTYAFLGFSYEVQACNSYDQLYNDFSYMKGGKWARFVRIYGSCEGDDDFPNRVIEAAAAAGLGVYWTIWFGFTGDDSYKGRMATFLSTLQSNVKAPYVIRSVALGTDPLFDSAITEADLASELGTLKTALAPFGIPVTTADMAYSFQRAGDSPDVFNAVDEVSLNIMPFFNNDATTANASWHSVAWNIAYGKQFGLGKRVTVSQTGWPSNTDVWPANSPNAVATLEQEQDYYNLLNAQCVWFKAQNVGWFAHIFDDSTLPGWGLLTGDGQDKLTFWPLTYC